MKKLFIIITLLIASLSMPVMAQTFAETKKLSEQGDAEEQYILGLMYQFGKGVTQDYQEAVKWHRKSAEQGHADAQYSLGRKYYTGNGVTQNYQEAIKWGRKSAEQGNAGGQFVLGTAYRLGKGVTQDYQEALKYYRKSAKQGKAETQFNLGLMYYHGNGVIQNYINAYTLALMAKANGYDDASVVIKGFSKDMTNSQIEQAQALASKCYESNYKNCDGLFDE
ncbi:MAG: sel1 repeat family protein [Alphaproteobacteria bacterium]|nr:sel1 repeat family protein [Alphaproteobacteria bacterium]